VAELASTEIAQLPPGRYRSSLGELRVPPWLEMRGWGYGDVAKEYPCWVVAAQPVYELVLVYSESGFGPTYPWGVLDAGSTSLGTDAAWFTRLAEAIAAFEFVKVEPDA